eukprot:6312081-Pyramimonas_sp.AAC.1
MPAFELRINSAIFDQFENWDCEESDKEQLRELKRELDQYRSAFESKDVQVRAFLEKVDKFEKEVVERMNKKRRTAGNDEGAAAGDGGGQG